MSADLTIRRARLVLPDRVVTGDMVIEDGVIAEIGPSVDRTAGEVIDGEGLTVLPGVIDPHVNFRDPSPNPSEDFATGSRAAAAGGVTAYLDAPQNDPPCTTVARLEAKLAAAAEHSAVHYGFFIGATEDNLDELNAAERACGIKVYLGHARPELTIRDPARLEAIFAGANKVVAVHAEDRDRLLAREAQYADTTDVRDHPRIRDVDSAVFAMRRVTELALKHGTRLHLLHLSSAEELELLHGLPRSGITAEVCTQHLFLHADDAYARMGTLVQCNPPVRTRRHAEALWQGLLDGRIDAVASDHSPHPRSKKGFTYPHSPSGMPNVEWTLPLLLDQVARGRCTLRDVARWTSEGPARCFGIPRKGRLETGYDGDIVVVDTALSRTVTHDSTRSAAGWSPWHGLTLTGWPVLTAVLGQPVFRDGEIVDGVRGRALTFAR